MLLPTQKLATAFVKIAFMGRVRNFAKALPQLPGAIAEDARALPGQLADMARSNPFVTTGAAATTGLGGYGLLRHLNRPQSGGGSMPTHAKHIVMPPSPPGPTITAQVPKEVITTNAEGPHAQLPPAIQKLMDTMKDPSTMSAAGTMAGVAAPWALAAGAGGLLNLHHPFRGALEGVGTLGGGVLGLRGGNALADAAGVQNPLARLALAGGGGLLGAIGGHKLTKKVTRPSDDE